LLGPIPLLRLPVALYDVVGLLREKPSYVMPVDAGCSVKPSRILREIVPRSLEYTAR
jgi:hypothetical protein